MRKSLVSFAALAMLLLVGGTVQAQPIVWTYVADSTKVVSDTPNPITLPTSWIDFKGQSYGSTNNSGIVIYKLATSSTVPDGGTPDTITNGEFKLGISFVDTKAAVDGVSGTKVVTDKVFFSGKLSASNITQKTFSFDALSWTSPLVAKVTLGGSDPSDGWRDYTVTVNPNFSFSAPGVPNGPDGSIYVDVKVTPGDGPTGSSEPPSPSPTPEPASLVLAGLGLPLFVLLRRRLKAAK